jgi:hypothetical protein
MSYDCYNLRPVVRLQRVAVDCDLDLMDDFEASGSVYRKAIVDEIEAHNLSGTTSSAPTTSSVYFLDTHSGWFMTYNSYNEILWYDTSGVATTTSAPTTTGTFWLAEMQCYSGESVSNTAYLTSGSVMNIVPGISTPVGYAIDQRFYIYFTDEDYTSVSADVIATPNGTFDFVVARVDGGLATYLMTDANIPTSGSYVEYSQTWASASGCDWQYMYIHPDNISGAFKVKNLVVS